MYKVGAIVQCTLGDDGQIKDFYSFSRYSWTIKKCNTAFKSVVFKLNNCPDYKLTIKYV